MEGDISLGWEAKMYFDMRGFGGGICIFLLLCVLTAGVTLSQCTGELASGSFTKTELKHETLLSSEYNKPFHLRV